MTVETDLDRAQYATNATTGPWTVPFYFLADAELAVTYTSSAGADTLLGLNVDYTVVGAGDESGGTITTTQAYAAGGQLVILRNVAFTQAVEYTDGDGFPAKTHERALDRLTMIAQQLRELFNRSIRFPASYSGSTDVGDVATRAGKLLGFDAISGAIVYVAASVGSALDLALQYAGSAGASLIGFIHGATGAVLRTVQDKLRERPTVMDFGAVGNYNGTTGFDDTSKLQAHVTYAVSTTNTGTYNSYSPAAGSGVVKVPQGSFQASSAISVASKVSIEGDGHPEYSYGSRLTNTVANVDLFQITPSGGSTSFSIEKMVLRSNVVGGGHTGHLVNMVRSGGGFVNSQRYTYNVFSQPQAMALNLSGDDILIGHNLFDVSGQSGDFVQLGTSSFGTSNVLVEGNDFFNAGRSCLKLVNIAGLTVSCNRVTQPNGTTKTPYFIDGTTPTLLQDITVNGNTVRGPRSFLAINGSANLTATGNTVAEGGIGAGESQSMITFGGSSNVNVALVANTFRGSYDTKHFYDDSAATSVTGIISSNTFQNDGGSGDALSCTKFVGRILSNFYAGFVTQQMGEKRATTGQPVTPGTLTAFGTGGATYGFNVTVAGATFGDKVDFGTISNGWIVPNGVIVVGFVSAANTARIEYRNMTPGSIAVPAHDIWTEVTR